MGYGQDFEMLQGIYAEIKKCNDRINELERELDFTKFELSESYNLISELQAKLV